MKDVSYTESMLPVCLASGCRYFLLAHSDRSATFYHRLGTDQRTYKIPKEDIDDVVRDIWGERLTPWIEQIHAGKE